MLVVDRQHGASVTRDQEVWIRVKNIQGTSSSTTKFEPLAPPVAMYPVQ